MNNIKEHESDTVGIVIADADGQHKVEDIIRVSEALKSSPDKLIMGCRRFSGKIPLRSKFGNNITKFVFSFAAGVKVSDTRRLAWLFLKAHTFYAVGKR